MTTTASKLFLGGAVAALLSAWIYGWGTGGGLTGVMLFGLLGGVGELTGYTVLVMASLVMAGLGTATALLRDADPETQAAVARLDAAPPVTVPASPSYLPVLGALGAVVCLIGAVASPVLFVIGALGLVLVTLEWMVTAWSERATGDAAVNRQIRNRLMFPIEIPVAGALVILVLVVSISRVLLTLDRNTSSAIAIVVGALILAGAFVIAYRPKLSKDAIAVALALGAVVLIGAGIAAATAGPRDFEHHEDEHVGDAEAGEHGAAPTTIELSETAS
jgi:hypothetical protein